MKRNEFLLHLIGQIAHYVLDAEPMRMVVSVHQEEDGVHLAVIDSNIRSSEELDKIRNALNNPDRPELASYYGSLAGFDMLGEARLDLVGWQIKAATVSSTQSGTRIDIWLGGDRFAPEQFTIHESS